MILNTLPNQNLAFLQSPSLLLSTKWITKKWKEIVARSIWQHRAHGMWSLNVRFHLHVWGAKTMNNNFGGPLRKEEANKRGFWSGRVVVVKEEVPRGKNPKLLSWGSAPWQATLGMLEKYSLSHWSLVCPPTTLCSRSGTAMQLAESSLWVECRSWAGMRGSTWAPAQTVGGTRNQGTGNDGCRKRNAFNSNTILYRKGKMSKVFLFFQIYIPTLLTWITWLITKRQERHWHQSPCPGEKRHSYGSSGQFFKESGLLCAPLSFFHPTNIHRGTIIHKIPERQMSAQLSIPPFLLLIH